MKLTDYEKYCKDLYLSVHVSQLKYESPDRCADWDVGQHVYQELTKEYLGENNAN